MLTPPQSRAARALVDWSQERLAGASNLSESTIRDFEKGRRVPATNNLIAIRRALEDAGVEFIPGGARLRDQDAGNVGQADDTAPEGHPS
jgi:transcriptional regulator with XRE-family HTH domain